MKKKLIKIAGAMAGGAFLLHSGSIGCLGDFWAGFFNTGWPTNNRWLNVALDVLNEELFG